MVTPGLNYYFMPDSKSDTVFFYINKAWKCCYVRKVQSAKCLQLVGIAPYAIHIDTVETAVLGAEVIFWTTYCSFFKFFAHGP